MKEKLTIYDNATKGLILLWVALFLVVFVTNPLATVICWNFVMPYLFGLPVITFWQAFAISILLDILVAKRTTTVINDTIDVFNKKSKENLDEQIKKFS